MRTYPLDEKAMMADLRGLMQIRTINHDCGPVTPDKPLGEGVYNALEYVLGLGRKYGFKTKMLDGYSGWIEMGEGEKLVGVLTHVDVVPVEPDGWVADPFDATLVDGKVIGRGICDDKGPTILTLHAMKALAESGVKLGKRIRLIVGGDEESGAWVCMKRYRQTEELPCCAFSPDGDYPSTYAEKGILHVTISRTLGNDIPELFLESGKTYNIVPATASARVGDRTYTAEGKAAHASRPELGVNAMRELCKKLEAEGVEHPFVKLGLLATREGFGIDMEDEPSGKLTLNPAISVVNKEEATLKCDLRVPVTITKEQVLEAISKAVEPLGFQVSSDFFLDPLYVAKDSELVTTLQRVYTDCTGRTDEPISVGGGTYARTFENAVAFGPLMPGEENMNHKTNEGWNYENMLRTYQILANVLEQL